MHICTLSLAITLDKRLFPSEIIKKHPSYCIIAWVLTWQREKDSNPHIRSQSPLCYLYTIPLNARDIIHFFEDLSSTIFPEPRQIFQLSPKCSAAAS